MKRKRFSEEQIIGVLREHEAGAKAGDLARKHGISEATLYNWKAKFGGMDVSDARRLKALEEENGKLKKLLADAMLDASALARASGKKMVGPAAKREAVARLRERFQMSERRACAVIAADRKMIRYQSRRPPETELRARLRDLANERRRFGYRRLFILLRREGEPSGINRIYRLYREEGLGVRKRKAQATGHWRQGSHPCRSQGQCPLVARLRPRPDGQWPAVPGPQHHRRRDPRMPGLHPGHLDLGPAVARELTAIIDRRGKPGMIVSDNGTELTSHAIFAWARDHQSTGTTSRRASPCRTAMSRASMARCATNS